MLQHAARVPETTDRTAELETLLDERILLLDGATGTQTQALGIDEAGVRGERFADHHKELKNFGDLLCLTNPEAVLTIHRRYLTAGSDIVETNTFGASPVGMLDFEFGDQAEDLAREINTAAVKLALQ
ncbi:MAG: homocysteine S-methyltransferase family protein, partial [Planctomycetota bacterium]